VNASTLWALAGDRAHARSLATEVLRLCAGQKPEEPEEEYYLRASEAEAALALGDLPAAETAIRKAGATAGNDFAALAGTRRQLRLLCAAEGIDPAILEPLATPTVAYYLGPSGTANLPPGREGELREAIDRALAGHRVGFAFGSLSPGAEIVFAEAALARGIELKVVFPFEIEEYRQLVVAPAGPEWVARFDRCLAGASEPVHYATTDSYLGDNGLFLYASRMAMGLALSKATTLDTEARLLAVKDDPSSERGDRFVEHETEFWGESGFPSDTVATLPPAGPGIPPALGREAPQRVGGRVVKSMLFGDVKGFSKLREVQLPVFAREVLGTFSRVLESFGHRIPVKNTWGDALYVVAEDAVTGADCALSLQEGLAELKPEEHGLPAHLGLRLGGHVGPVFPVDDPVLGYRSYMGVHVSRTARIEPITPVGSVYVTEAFAAALALDRERRFTTEYVGHIPAAKDWGKLRVYVLRRSPTAPPPEE
jgi:class 3 adenylate cyclase